MPKPEPQEISIPAAIPLVQDLLADGQVVRSVTVRHTASGFALRLLQHMIQHVESGNGTRKHLVAWPPAWVRDDPDLVAPSVEALRGVGTELLSIRLAFRADQPDNDVKAVEAFAYVDNVRIEDHEPDDGTPKVQFGWTFGEAFERLVTDAGDRLPECGLLPGDWTPQP